MTGVPVPIPRNSNMSGDVIFRVNTTSIHSPFFVSENFKVLFRSVIFSTYV